MKKSILAIVLLCFVTSIFSQQEVRNKEYYLKRSHNQKNAGLITLGGGTALVIAGILIGNAGSDDAELDNAMTGGIMVVAGASSIVISIPLLIASARNKRKAEKATALFKIESLQSPALTMYPGRSFPALGIQIGL
jgi:hypothetical protein